MTVVYDDDDVVVVDKPPGLAAHPAPSWDGPSVLGALAGAGYRISTSGPPERQGIVHRLDVGTSGLMAVAKSEVAYSVLKRAFKAREVEKIYHALVQGHPDPSTGTIDAPIGRHPSSSWRFAVVAGGRDSITHYETLEAFPAASLMSVSLETGRTHQIRVHMAAHRHPIVGDTLYGADPVLAERLGLERQWLHAMELSFVHPVSHKQITVRSTYPDDLQGALDRLRG
jgi:23S rRNA pseudouridine1911/1915/1917 synthase